MRELTKVEKKLIDMLYKIRDSRDFVIGVVAPLVNDEERAFVIECIEKNIFTTPPKLVLLAVSIKRHRNDKD